MLALVRGASAMKKDLAEVRLLPVLEYWCQLGGADQASITKKAPRTADALCSDVRAEAARLARLRGRRGSPRAYDACVAEAQRRHKQRPLHPGAIVGVYTDSGGGRGVTRGVIVDYVDAAGLYAVKLPYAKLADDRPYFRYESPLHLYPLGAPIPPFKVRHRVIANRTRAPKKPYKPAEPEKPITTYEEPKKQKKKKKRDPLRDPPNILDDTMTFALSYHLRNSDKKFYCDVHELGEMAGQILAYVTDCASGVGRAAYKVFVADVDDAPSWNLYALSIVEDLKARGNSFYACYDVCCSVVVDPQTGEPLVRHKVQSLEPHADYLPQYHATHAFAESLGNPKKWELLRVCLDNDENGAFDILRRLCFQNALHNYIHRAMKFHSRSAPVENLLELLNRVYTHLGMDASERLFVNRFLFPYNACWRFVQPLCDICLEALRKERDVIHNRRWSPIPHDTQIATLKKIHDDFSSPLLAASLFK